MAQQQQQQSEIDFQQNDVLLNSFFIDKKKFRALLHYDKLVWEKENSKGNKNTVSLDDIISVKTSKRQKTCSTTLNSSSTNFQHNPGSSCNNSPPVLATPTTNTTLTTKILKNSINETNYTENGQYLIVHYAKRVKNSRTDHNCWRKNTLTLYSIESHIVKLWYDTLITILNKQKRPKRILMFINPYGGRKQALNLYEKYAKPLFQLANIEISCIISQRANQIRDMIMVHSLDQYDAVCCAGGDGTFAEVFNGLIFRTIKDLNMDPLRPEYIPKPKLPIGVIPAGSTDTVSYCLHGTTDVRTAVIHIILGQTRGLDLSSVCNSNGLIRLFASVMSYGYLGDVALDSEKFRWMGPKRYDYSGFKKIIANHGYEGEIIYQVEKEDTYKKGTITAITTTTTTTTTTTNTTTTAISATTNDEIDLKCYVNCIRCCSKDNLSRCNNSMEHDDQDDIDNIQNKNMYNRSNSIDYILLTPSTSPETDNNDGNITTTTTSYNLAKNSRNDGNYNNSNDSNSGDNKNDNNDDSDEIIWKNIRGKFFMISGANIACSCSRSPNGFSPYNHLGDGYIDIILVRHTTFINNIRLLLTLISRNNDIQRLPFVELHRTRRFYFRAQTSTNNGNSIAGSCQPITISIDNKTSQWNCDGEIIHDSDVLISSHCQLIDVFMRGPHPLDESSKTTTCCNFCRS